MATVAPSYDDNRMSIGRVFQRAFSAVTQNPLVVLGLALFVGALPGLVMSYLFVKLGFFAPAALQSGAFSFRAMMGATLLSSLVGIVIAALVQGALTRAVVTANEGRRASFGESIATGLRVILPLIGLSIVIGIGVMIGFVLLIVPGIVLLLVWAVAVPALVVERVGIFDALRRSAELTKDSRWKILGLFLVLLVVYWVLSAILGAVGLKMYSAATAATGLTVFNLLGSIVLGTVFNTLWGTIQPSLYVELRQSKEGDSAQHLAEVFA
jgi:uncharacterized membrane protein